MMTNTQQVIEPTEEDLLKEREEKMARLQALGTTLAGSRLLAIQARANSGIEADWQQDEEFYEGIDDANRATKGNRSAPITPDGSSVPSRVGPIRSTVFLNITRPYVDASAAKVADMLLPTDEQNWTIKETPVADLVKASKDNTPLLTADGKPQMMDVETEQGVQQQQMTVADHAKQIQQIAKDKAKAAEKRIQDWLVQCQYNSEVRKVIEDASRIGTGILKGPTPIMRKKRSVKTNGGLIGMEFKDQIDPSSKAVSAWNLFPDPACGDNIHNGSYVWERDQITKRQIRELANDSTYIRENLLKVLDEGASANLATKIDVDKGLGAQADKERYDIWYYYGYIDQEDMESAGCTCEDMEQVPAMIVMINDHVVKAAMNPLDSGEFPYDVMVWQARVDYWAGLGVGNQMQTPQKMLNAGTRNMMDNAGLSAGPMLVVNRRALEPADGTWEFAPRKIFLTLEDSDGRPVSEFITAINIPTMQAELMGIIQFAQKMAEDVTGLPMLLQGQQGQAPETVGGMQMLNNNASTVMRRLARTFDDRVTERHIARYYEWLLMYGEDENEKGDFFIDARGSSALVERDLQNQMIAQMGAVVVNPAFGVDPRRWFGEYCRSQRLDPGLFQYTEEEMKQMQEQAAKNPPQDPNMIRANAQLQSAQMTTQQRTQEAELRLQDAREDRQYKMQMAQLERDTEMVRLANNQKISLEKIKAQLASIAMVEKNKRDLYADEKQLAINTGSGI